MHFRTTFAMILKSPAIFFQKSDGSKKTPVYIAINPVQGMQWVFRQQQPELSDCQTPPMWQAKTLALS